MVINWNADYSPNHLSRVTLKCTIKYFFRFNWFIKPIKHKKQLMMEQSEKDSNKPTHCTVHHKKTTLPSCHLFKCNRLSWKCTQSSNNLLKNNLSFTPCIQYMNKSTPFNYKKANHVIQRNIAYKTFFD